jgi:PAS domain-containing protein
MGALWILVTEAIVVVQLGEFTTVSLINIVKGLVYVLITALLLFAIVFDNFRKVYAMNEKLKTSEASLLEAQRLAHIGSYAFDARSGHVQCTDEVLRILGIPTEAFGGCVETLLDCLRPQDREALIASTSRNKPAGDDSAHRARMWARTCCAPALPAQV